MVSSVCERIYYYSPDDCLKQDRCAMEHGYSPYFSKIATSSKLSLILLTWIKMVTRQYNLGRHLTDHQGAAFAR
jgi:hypothetical protein